MDNRYFKQAVEYKYCYDCKYYEVDNKCGIMLVKTAILKNRKAVKNE